MANIPSFTHSCFTTSRLLIFAALLSSYNLILSPTSAQLTANFYSTSCPGVFNAVREVLDTEIDRQNRVGAFMIRLFFHDCFVDGCDGGVLLSGGEQDVQPNVNSLRGYDVVDAIKTNVEATCGGVVSCADILAIAARDSVVKLGGSSYEVLLGRRDALTSADPASVPQELPLFTETIQSIRGKFSSKGLNDRDLVALSGAHTVGFAQCATFRDRIYSGTDIDPTFATNVQANCPSAQNQGSGNLEQLDVQTPDVFDNDYFNNLIQQRGLLRSDQDLMTVAALENIVRSYATNGNSFSGDFAAAMTKMGNLSPLTGNQGEIRSVCSRRNA